MREIGVEALLSDRLSTQPGMEERVWKMNARALRKAGAVGPIATEKHRLILSAVHLQLEEFSDCPYVVYGREHPDADKDEFPVCGKDEHWSLPFVGWACYSYAEAPDAP